MATKISSSRNGSRGVFTVSASATEFTPPYSLQDSASHRLAPSGIIRTTSSGWEPK
jgi:hypothetical protein